MGGLPPTSSRRQTQKAQRRVSQAKTHLATPLVEDRRPKTPPTHEELFTQEADYDAVFRSRPKIKLSPVVSPEREREERLVRCLRMLTRTKRTRRPGCGLLRALLWGAWGSAKYRQSHDMSRAVAKIKRQAMKTGRPHPVLAIAPS